MKSPAAKSTVRLFLGTRHSAGESNPMSSWDRERGEDSLDTSLWNRALRGLRRPNVGTEFRMRTVQ